MKQYDDKYLVPALQKAVTIVQLVAQGNSQVRMSDLMSMVGCSKSHLFALLNTLCKYGWLCQNEDTTFSIGDTLVLQGTMRLYPLELVRQFHSEFSGRRDLSEDFTYQMSVLEGTEIIYLAKTQIGNAGKVITFPGMRLPAHCTAMGKALLSQYSFETLESLYKGRVLEQLTPNSVSCLEDLWEQITAFRNEGVALEVGEAKTGYSCVASVVRNAFGRVAAAVSMATLLPYPSAEHNRALYEVKELCGRISARVGYVTHTDEKS